MVDATETKSLFAAGILFLTHILRIGESSLVISTASTSHCSLQTWCGGACGEACTSGEVVLCWFCAVKASLLAPSKEASSLAILKPVIGSCIVALAAGGRDAKVGLHARREFVVVDATETKSLLAASILLFADILRICKSSLIIGRAATCRLQARCGRASWDSSASWKVSLGRGGAVKAALFAPAKEAFCLAICKSIIGGRGITFTTSTADSNFGGHTSIEFVMVNATQTQSLFAAFVALVTKIVGIKTCDGCLIICGAAGSRSNSNQTCKNNFDHAAV